MYHVTLLNFSSAVIAACALMWGAELAFPKSVASASVLVSVTALGLWMVRPGWHLTLWRLSPYWLALFGLVLASAAVAARFLIHFEVPLPYDLSALDVMAAAPAILLITGIEELLFRQVMYRWLEQRGVSSRTAVVATAFAFGWAHLGPVFIGSPTGATFYLLQSAYMLWIGILLGEVRRASGSWPMSWLGHFSYNLTVLYFLSIA